MSATLEYARCTFTGNVSTNEQLHKIGSSSSSHYVGFTAVR
jgi:hypothetical protein